MKNKLLIKLFLLPIFILFGSTVYAQTTVTGTVSEEGVGPIPGANIVVKGTSVGTQTDFDGNYTIDVPSSDAVLVFSYIGLKTQEISVNGRSTINVALAEDATQLSEVVVIGYGTTTIKDATGAVAAVTSEDFNQGVIASPEQLIQGKTAGVQISQSSGEPGAGVDIRIRGTGSVRSNNNPLFVVDGVPLGGSTSAEATDIGFGSSSAKNPLTFLNPNDIESISILKDASATAIYGSRGANGVVIITTKSGKSGEGGQFEFNSSYSVATSRKNFDLLDAGTYLSETTRLGLVAGDRDFGSDTDWQDVVLRTSFSHNQNLAYSQNYGKGFVRATLGYGDQAGIIENSSLQRLTGRVNAVHRFLDDKLKLNLQATVSGVTDESPPLSGSAGFRGDLLGSAYSANPTWPNDPDFADTGGLLSPATMLAYTQSNTNTTRVLLNFSAEYNFTKELSGKINFGYDKSTSTREAAASALARNFDQGTFGNGSGAINDLDIENRLIEATLTYTKAFENSNLEALAGYSFQDFGTSGRNITGWGFGTDNLGQMVTDLENAANSVENAITGSYQQYGYATNLPDIFINRLFPDVTTDNIPLIGGLNVNTLFTDTFDNTDMLQSFFGRVNYSIADKYLFTATVRADGSSRFSEDNRYGIFPSAAFAWKMHNEDFIDKETFSNLKLRLGFGITGNQDGLGYGNFVERERFAGGDIISDGGEIANPPGTVTVAFANPDLKWEQTTQYGLGIDFGFMDDRLTGSFDLYRKETKDLLFNILSAQPAVQPFVFLNLPDSKVVNEGFEFAINYELVNTEDFSWDASFNVAYNSNMIEQLTGEYDAGTIRGQGLSLAFAQRLQEGQPLFSYFLRDFQGFDAAGAPIQEDIQVFVGQSALPDITSGLSTNVRYKNWSFSAYFNGQFGNYVYNNTANAFFTAGAFRSGRNVLPETLTAGESLDAAADVSTRFLEKGDFVRLQNLTASYNVPVADSKLFKSLIVSLTGQNLFVITGYSGIDPEVSVSPAGIDLLNGLPVFGIDYTSFPRPTTVTLGINAKF